MRGTRWRHAWPISTYPGLHLWRGSHPSPTSFPSHFTQASQAYVHRQCRRSACKCKGPVPYYDLSRIFLVFSWVQSSNNQTRARVQENKERWKGMTQVQNLCLPNYLYGPIHFPPELQHRPMFQELARFEKQWNDPSQVLY